MVHSSNKLLLLNCILFVCLLWKPIYGQFDSNTDTRRYNMPHSANEASESANHRHIEQHRNTNTHGETPQQSSFRRANTDIHVVPECDKLTGINMYGLSQKFHVFWTRCEPILRAMGCFLGKAIVASARWIIYSVSNDCHTSHTVYSQGEAHYAGTPAVPINGACPCQQKETTITSTGPCSCSSANVAPKPIDVEVDPHQAQAHFAGELGANPIGVTPAQSYGGCSNFLSTKLYGLSTQISYFLSGAIKSLMELIIERVEYFTACNSGCGSGINMYTLMQRFKVIVIKLAPILQKCFDICLRMVKGTIHGMFVSKFAGPSCSSHTAFASNINNIPLTGINVKDVFGGKIKKK